jgi:hypothetical protein
MKTDKASFANAYTAKSNEELLRLAREKDSLQEPAQKALDLEMEKRGLGEGAVVRFDEQEKEAVESNKEVIQKKPGSNWLLNSLKCLGILAPAALITIVTANSILKLPSEAVRLLTVVSLRVALALSFVAGAAGSRWSFKRTAIAAIILSVGLFGFIVWAAQRHP